MKRSIAMLLTLAVCIGLAGCGNSAPASTAASSAGADQVEAVTDPMAKYDPSITLTVGRASDNPNLPDIEGQTAEDNVWLDAYRDELGIEIEDSFVVAQEQMEEKMNLQIASGQVPDLMVLNRKQFEMVMESGLAEDLTPYFEQYASEQTKEMMNLDGGSCMDMCTVDGSLYAIPGMQGYMEGAPVITWIRQDWLDKLNLEKPETFEELQAVVKAFVENDPDGNGIDDTVGFPTTKTLNEIAALFTSFGAYPTQWIKDDNGEVVYGGVQPEVKDALAFLNEMYNEKILSPEFGASEWGQYMEQISSGKVGVVWGQWWFIDWPLNSTHEALGAEWVPLPIYSATEDPVKVMAVSGPHSYYVVRKGYEHPEAVIKILNLWFEKAYGSKEDIATYHKNEAGDMPANFSIMTPWRAHEDLYYYQLIRDRLAGKETEEMPAICQVYYDNVVKYMETGDESAYLNYKMYGPESPSAIIEQYINDDMVIFDQFYGAYTETMAEKWALLDANRMETYIKIIMGDEPIDAFDTFVENWYASGGEEVTEEVRAWVSENS